MMKHFDYVDTLKGIAIILVVVGHNLAWNIDDFETFISCGRRSDMFWFHLIYKFHMPLFFWISGFLLPKESLSMHEFRNVLWKRTYTLLIPFFCAGFVMDKVSQSADVGGGNLWFLIALYQLLLLGLIFEAARCKFHLGIKSMLVLYLGGFFLLRVLYINYGDTPMGKYLHFETIYRNNYIGFVFGIICRRYLKLSKLFETNISYTVCFLLFSLLLYAFYTQMENTILLYMMSLLTPLCGIVCVVYLARNVISQSSRYTRVLNYLGKHSLELYIIHFFFNFRLFMLSDYAISMIHSSSYRDVFWGHTCMLVSSMFFSAIMIVLSVLTMYVIRTSNLLSILLLGRKN